ncbi:MAG: DUF748 domain-containing protein [Aquabacterium sp.]
MAVATWLAAWHWLPGALVPRIEAAASAELGRSVTIQALSTSPTLLRWRLDGLKVAGAGAGGPPLLDVQAIEAKVSVQSLWQRAPVLQSLRIDAPHLRLQRHATGGTDVDDVIAHLRARPVSPQTEPARFALYNLVVEGGRVQVRDETVGRRHELASLSIGLPFLSNLPVHLKVAVQPRLAFSINGAGFESAGSAVPFDEHRRAQLDFRLSQFDLALWLAYLPEDLPLQPTRARLDGQWSVAFEQPAGTSPTVRIAGRFELTDLQLVGGARKPLLDLARLSVVMDDVQPLSRRVGLGEVLLDGLQLHVARLADGRISGMPGAALPTPVAPASEAGLARPAAAPAEAAAWKVSATRVAVRGARLDWRDAWTRPASRLALDGIEIESGPLSWPGAEAMQLSWTASLGSGDGKPGAPLAGIISGSPLAARLTLQAKSLRAAWAAPYLARWTQARVAGNLAFDADVDWRAAGGSRLRVATASLTDLAVMPPDDARARLAWRSLSISGLDVDLDRRQVQVRQLALASPVVRARRAADGSLEHMSWWRAGTQSAPSATARPSDLEGAEPSPRGPPESPDPTWSVVLGSFAVTQGDLHWDDASGATPVSVRLSDGRLQMGDLRWPVSGPGGRIDGSLTLISALQPEVAGRLSWNGRWRPSPAGFEGRLEADQLPLSWAATYAQGLGPVRLADARLRWRGDLAASLAHDGARLQMRGDATLTDLDLRSTTAPSGSDELLNWQSLALVGLAVDLQPGRAPQIQIADATLSDFYARLLINEKGQLNLQPPEADKGAAPSLGGSVVSAGAIASVSAASAAAPAATASSPGATAMPSLMVGNTRVTNGRIDFTDRFIKPSYSAALSELGGTLGPFSSAAPELASLSLRGRVAGTGLLEVTGAVHPMTRPPALDLQARASDLDLAPLSPYAGKYAGYAIERGKLTMDVRYRLQSDGRLEASNQIILNQLTFGERVDSPDATKLPVLLAVALLKDRNGVIDIDLPIRGSLDDPQFSVAGLIVKVIVNLLTKALLSPFSLLGGGQQDLSQASFVAGTARLTDAGVAVMDKVAQALVDRPALNMTIAGSADPVAEREAMQATAFDVQLALAHRRALLRTGLSGAALEAAPTPAQREAALRQLYRDSRLPDRPRTVLGTLKDVPPPDMEQRLRSAVAVTPESTRELALQRAVAARAVLEARGLPGARVFLAAPRLRTADEADWTPRVQMVLATP